MYGVAQSSLRSAIGRVGHFCVTDENKQRARGRSTADGGSWAGIKRSGGESQSDSDPRRIFHHHHLCVKRAMATPTTGGDVQELAGTG